MATKQLGKGGSETLVDLGTVGTSQTLDITSATQIFAALSPSTLCVFAMPSVRGAAGSSFVLYLRQPAATGGNGSAAFTGPVAWQGGIAPTITPNPGREDILTFICDGRIWLGSAAQNYYVEDVSAGARTSIVIPNAGKHWGGRGIRTLGQVVRRGKD